MADRSGMQPPGFLTFPAALSRMEGMDSLRDPIRILVVESATGSALAEADSLSVSGYSVVRGSPEIAAARLAFGEVLPSGSPFDLVLMDLDGGRCAAACEEARTIRARGGPPVLFLYSGTVPGMAIRTEGSGGFGFVRKGEDGAVLLAAVRMALDLALEGAVWPSRRSEFERLLGSTADLVFSIDRDRRISWVHRPRGNEPGSGSSVGKIVYDIVTQDSLPSVRSAVEGVFADGRVRSFRAREKGDPERPDGHWYETYVGPIWSGDEIVGATLASRDVTEEVRLASGGDLSEDERRGEIEDLLVGLDLTPLHRLLGSFSEATKFPISLVSVKGEVLFKARWQRLCREFFRADDETAAECEESDRKANEALSAAGGRPFLEYTCPHGLREIAQPVFVEGVRWATIFFGQFLYAGEVPDEAKLRLKAHERGWDEDDFLAAAREVPVVDRSTAIATMSFAAELGNLVSGLALAAARERRIARHFRMSEAARAESERRYRLLADNAGDVIWTLELPSLRISYISPSVTRLRGLTVEEAMAEGFQEMLLPASQEKARLHIEEMARLCAVGDPRGLEPFTDTYEMPCKDGSVKTVEITAKAVGDQEGRAVELVGITRDATQRIRDEVALKKALADKDVLFGELQHRVKNSLALIASLLSLESSSLPAGQARASLESARSRIDTIARLYQQLYSSRSVSDIRIGDYLRDVAASVVESLSDGGAGIALDFGAVDAVLDTRRAVLVGLILNELVVNAIKYGCPGGRGRIGIRLGKEGPGLRLAVSDEGPGLPPGFSLPGKGWEGGSLGFTLVSQLAGQLSGTLSAGQGPGGKGASFAVVFPLEGPRPQA